jgi:hypothetical protein
LPAQAISLARQGSLDRAVELLGLAVTYPVEITGWMLKWPPLTQVRADLERELGADVYRAAWERGSALDLERTVEEFL